MMYRANVYADLILQDKYSPNYNEWVYQQGQLYWRDDYKNTCPEDFDANLIFEKVEPL